MTSSLHIGQLLLVLIHSFIQSLWNICPQLIISIFESYTNTSDKHIEHSWYSHIKFFELVSLYFLIYFSHSSLDLGKFLEFGLKHKIRIKHFNIYDINKIIVITIRIPSIIIGIKLSTPVLYFLSYT